MTESTEGRVWLRAVIASGAMVGASALFIGVLMLLVVSVTNRVMHPASNANADVAAKEEPSSADSHKAPKLTKPIAKPITKVAVGGGRT